MRFKYIPVVLLSVGLIGCSQKDLLQPVSFETIDIEIQDETTASDVSMDDTNDVEGEEATVEVSTYEIPDELSTDIMNADDIVSDKTILVPSEYDICLDMDVSPIDQTEDEFGHNINEFYLLKDTKKLVYIEGYESSDDEGGENRYRAFERDLTDDDIEDIMSRYRDLKSIGSNPNSDKYMTVFEDDNNILTVYDTDTFNFMMYYIRG